MPAPFLFAAVGGERMMARRQDNKKTGTLTDPGSKVGKTD